MMIDTLEAVQFGGITQWMRIRGTDQHNPVLLLMQYGPGLPIINETRRFERLLRLEEAFTVVYWDQRGTGLSLRNANAEISKALMISDTVSMLEWLSERFGSRIFVAGFSFGAMYAAYAATQRPDLVAALIATGMDIDVPMAEKWAYEFVRETARQRGNKRALRQMDKIGPPPHLDVKKFSTRARWAFNFGGVTTNWSYNDEARTLVASLLRSPDYTVADLIRTVRGATSSTAALLPDLADTDLVRTVPRLEVPIVLVQGRLDQVAPGEAAQRYYEAVTAPSKDLVWFDTSAHSPHL
ncbi:alpha/beta hydrolase, partial [Streptosporangiaceae bacterium NEAU-GS5]|nr:alpha/beta hydrolase [Streptosporangiaceae bacterium NEAU-GS5]